MFCITSPVREGLKKKKKQKNYPIFFLLKFSLTSFSPLPPYPYLLVLSQYYKKLNIVHIVGPPPPLQTLSKFQYLIICSCNNLVEIGQILSNIYQNG